MEKGNQPVSDSPQQELDRCIPCCITLQKDMAMTVPYLKIATKAMETAKQEMSAIVDPQTKVVATVPKVQVNIPAPKWYGSTSTQTKSVEVFATTAKIDTMDTNNFFCDTLNGRFNHLTAWGKAITTVEDAVKEAQATWNCIYPMLQSVVEVMTKWMGKDRAIVAQFADKSNTLSSYTEVCYITNVLDAFSILFLKKYNCSLPHAERHFIEYVKNRVADLDTFEKLTSRAKLNTSRLHQVVEGWKKDMCGIWGTAETIVKSRSTTMEDWIGTKDQVTIAAKVIVDARQKVMARRPYTEIWFAAIYISHSDYRNIGPPVYEAMIVFEKLEEAIEQIEKDVITLAEVLNELFPASKADPAMGKGNRQISTLFPKGLEDCIQGCIKLQEDTIITDPLLEISSKAMQTAQQEISAIMAAPLATATVSGVPDAKLKGMSTTTAKIATVDTRYFPRDAPNEHLIIPHLTMWAAVVEEAWNHIYPALQSVIEVMADWMGKDKDIVARFADKSSTLSFYAGVYRVANTWYAILTQICEKEYHDLPTGEVDFMAYVQNRTANTDKIGTVERLKQRAKGTKFCLSILVSEWKRDMCGMWGTAETIVKSESATMGAWIRTKDQVAKVIKIIVDSRQKMMARRSYTEIFAILYSPHDRLKKVIPPVLDAIVAFEKLEEEMKQIEEDVSTLAKALNGLFPASEAASSQIE
jgi:hypothetical protein